MSSPAVTADSLGSGPMAYKAFVSSTFADIQDHRGHVIQQLRRAGITVDPMEDWTAAADEPKEFSTRRLEGCHLCVLLVARRRGHVPQGESRSITQMEYDEANRRGIDVLTYLLDDGVPEDEWPWEEPAEMRRWRGHLLEHRGVESFQPAPASIEIAPALTRWVSQQGPKVALRLYLGAVQKEHGSIQFVSLPRLEDNPDAPIQRLFVQPHVADRWVSPDADPDKWPKTMPILDALAKHEKLVVLGDPGSGKSTLVSWLSWRLAQSGMTLRIGDDPAVEQAKFVPIPLVLRDLGIQRSGTWDKLLEAFAEGPLGRLLTLDNLRRIFGDGRAMIMLDGLDEVANPALRRDLRDAVWKAFAAYHDCRWLLTSRIVGYDEVPFDVDLPAKSPKREMIALSESESKADVRYVAPFNDDQVEQFARNWFVLREASDVKAEQGAEQLIGAVRSHESTRKLGRIPNLLTMMALIYRVKAVLPHGRALLYNEIAEAYLLSIDQWRRILTRVEPWEERRRWLARVAFEMQRRRASPSSKHNSSLPQVPSESTEILAPGDQVRTWVAAAMNEAGGKATEADAAEFVDYLGRRTGLLVPRGEDQFAFLHLSFQEYFAACYLIEQIVSPGWLMDDAEEVAAGTSQADLRAAAGEIVWRETMLFLIELFAAEQPKWLRKVHACLFGDDFSDIAHGNESCRERALLLARLTVDPHAGFRDAQGAIDAAGRRAVEACCRWEVNWQTQQFDKLRWPENDVLRILLSCDPPDERRTILQTVLTFAQQADVRGLNLTGTAIADLTPLSGLPSLQYLELSGTPVSDLTPLSGLASLEELHLSRTPVSDLTPLSGLASLQALILASTPVSDESVAALQNARRLAGLPEIQDIIR
jgi:internalin A